MSNLQPIVQVELAVIVRLAGGFGQFERMAWIGIKIEK
jgi:hypothetical protein